MHNITYPILCNNGDGNIIRIGDVVVLENVDDQMRKLWKLSQMHPILVQNDLGEVDVLIGFSLEFRPVESRRDESRD